MIELIREKFPIFLLLIGCSLFLFVGKAFYDDQIATTKYKGVVVDKGYELPTSGYKSSTDIYDRHYRVGRDLEKIVNNKPLLREWKLSLLEI